MARWAPARADVIGEIADEILHNYRAARAVVGVDGEPGSGAEDFADDLATALDERGSRAYRASVGPRSEDAELAREQAVGPFRRSEKDYADEGPAVLVLDGTRLHGPDLLSAFVYTVWLTAPARGLPADDDQRAYERRAAPRVKATANVDTSDPEHPRRTFADSC